MNLEKRYLIVTKENYNEVAKKLEELGIVWGGYKLKGKGVRPIQHNPFDDKILGGIKKLLLIVNEGRLFLDHTISKNYYIANGYTELETYSTPTIKLVNKLEDLDGLISEDGKYRLYKHPQMGYIQIEHIGTKASYSIIIHELNQEVVDMLKQKGFKFEMKSKRTKEEIVAEIEKLAELPSESKDKYRIGTDYPRIDKFKYWKLDTNITTYPRVKGLTREDAERLCNELNSL